MAKKPSSAIADSVGMRSTASPTSPPKRNVRDGVEVVPTRAKPSAFVDTRVNYGGDNLEQLQKMPGRAVIIPLTVKGIFDEQIIGKLA